MSDATGPTVALNGRFLTMTPTGVQRYARELLPLVADPLGRRLAVVVPPDRVVRGDDPALAGLLAEAPVLRWHGVRGHRWEQLTLPGIVRRLRAGVVWSPCSWGPLRLRRQVVVVHDIGPLTHPQLYETSYRLLAKLLTGPLVRRTTISTPSDHVAGELARVLKVDRRRIAVVPPGVGEPFSSWPVDDVEDRPRRWCVLVGGHDARKNAAFLVDLWPGVLRATGLQLHVTRRSVVTTRGAPDLPVTDGVVVHIDPSDDELARLYAGAVALLWPSGFEGYGFPLLEAMAVGTPFLSTDVGAAGELAIDRAAQILPLDPVLWAERVIEWAGGSVDHLRRPSIELARSRTWAAAADQTIALLETLASRGS